MDRIKNRIFIISFLISFSYNQEFILLKKNITSQLNTTDIIEFNNSLIVSTTGGLYSYNDNQNNILNNNLDVLNISCLNKKLYNEIKKKIT